MTYELDALIGKDTLATVPQMYHLARLVPLPYELQMIPLTDALFREMIALRSALTQIPPVEEAENTTGLPFWFAKRGLLSYAIADLARQLSEKGPVAYVQADFFGGVGGQSAIIWQQGQIVLAVDGSGIGAINQALRYLEVRASDEGWFDEFSMVGLGRHRFTERWVQEEVRDLHQWESEQLLLALAGAEKGLRDLPPENPVYQIAVQQKQWAEQQLEKLRQKLEDQDGFQM